MFFCKCFLLQPCIYSFKMNNFNSSLMGRVGEGVLDTRLYHWINMASEVLFYIHKPTIFLLFVGFNACSLSSVASGEKFFHSKRQDENKCPVFKALRYFSFLFLTLSHSNFQAFCHSETEKGVQSVNNCSLNCDSLLVSAERIYPFVLSHIAPLFNSSV